MLKALYVLLMICAIPTMIWICFEIGGAFTVIGIILLGACIIFVGGIIIGAIKFLFELFLG